MVPSLLFSVLLMQAAPPAAETPKPPAEKAAEKPSEKEEPPVVTHHEIRVNGKALKYTATAGMMPIRDAKGETEAHMFFMAYTLDGVTDTGRRPLMFPSTAVRVRLRCGCIWERWGRGAL